MSYFSIPYVGPSVKELAIADADLHEPQCAPAHLTRTAGEFLGSRPIPKVIASRHLVFLLGPCGSGKSSVSQRFLETWGVPSSNVLRMDGAALRAQLVSRARYGKFAATTEQAPGLILDGVDCLFGREGAVSLLGGLLRDRCARGLKTVVVQSPADDSISLLYAAAPPQVRASVLLRFPVGRGRRRFVQQECRRLSLPFSLARDQVVVEPWTYASVRAAIEALAVGAAVAPDSGAVHRPSAEMPG